MRSGKSSQGTPLSSAAGVPENAIKVVTIARETLF